MHKPIIPLTPKEKEPPAEVSEEKLNSRRNALKQMAAAMATALLAGEVAHAQEPNVTHMESGGATPATEEQPVASPPQPTKMVDPLIRMQEELKRALKKPVKDRRWVMVIDQRKCTGCHACTIGCVAENKCPPGVVYRPVIEQEIGTYPNVKRRCLPRPCLQCDNPPCTPVCPVNATWKGEDGIVHIDYETCIGCRYCLTACPYGARTFDFGDHHSDGTPNQKMAAYDFAPNFEYGKKWDREGHGSPVGNARKCHFCVHRLDGGMLPMCVTTCLGRATYFGDANDPKSLVAELIAQPNVMRLKEELGTEPRVYYLT